MSWRNKKERKTKRSAELDDISDITIQNKISDFSHPGIALENQQRAQILFSAIDKLPEQQRIAFTLAKVEFLSYEEIGAVMEKSVSSIESLFIGQNKTSVTY